MEDGNLDFRGLMGIAIISSPAVFASVFELVSGMVLARVLTGDARDGKSHSLYPMRRLGRRWSDVNGVPSGKTRATQGDPIRAFGSGRGHN